MHPNQYFRQCPHCQKSIPSFEFKRHKEECRAFSAAAVSRDQGHSIAVAPPAFSNINAVAPAAAMTPPPAIATNISSPSSSIHQHHGGGGFFNPKTTTAPQHFPNSNTRQQQQQQQQQSSSSQRNHHHHHLHQYHHRSSLALPHAGDSSAINQLLEKAGAAFKSQEDTKTSSPLRRGTSALVVPTSELVTTRLDTQTPYPSSPRLNKGALSLKVSGGQSTIHNAPAAPSAAAVDFSSSSSAAVPREEEEGGGGESNYSTTIFGASVESLVGPFDQSVRVNQQQQQQSNSNSRNDSSSIRHDHGKVPKEVMLDRTPPPAVVRTGSSSVLASSSTRGGGGGICPHCHKLVGDHHTHFCEVLDHDEVGGVQPLLMPDQKQQRQDDNATTTTPSGIGGKGGGGRTPNLRNKAKTGPCVHCFKEIDLRFVEHHLTQCVKKHLETSHWPAEEGELLPVPQRQQELQTGGENNAAPTEKTKTVDDLLTPLESPFNDDGSRRVKEKTTTITRNDGREERPQAEMRTIENASDHHQSKKSRDEVLNRIIQHGLEKNRKAQAGGSNPTDGAAGEAGAWKNSYQPASKLVTTPEGEVALEYHRPVRFGDREYQQRLEDEMAEKEMARLRAKSALLSMDSDLAVAGGRGGGQKDSSSLTNDDKHEPATEPGLSSSMKRAQSSLQLQSLARHSSSMASFRAMKKRVDPLAELEPRHRISEEVKSELRLCILCEELIPRSEFFAHLDVCKANVKSCPYCNAGIPISELDDHVPKCEANTRDCYICGARIQMERLPDHLLSCGSGGKIIHMYHGTDEHSAREILKHGFQPSTRGLLGAGVYLSRDKNKAQNYGPVIVEAKVDIGKVALINKKGHHLQKCWRSHGYDSAWIPANCGMVSSGLEEHCVYDPRRVAVVRITSAPNTKS